MPRAFARPQGQDASSPLERQIGSELGARTPRVAPRRRPLAQSFSLPRRTVGSPTIKKVASRAGPAEPDPQSQSLSRSYGSNLPTSLTYINLSTRGSTPRRPAAESGTVWPVSSVTSDSASAFAWDATTGPAQHSYGTDGTQGGPAFAGARRGERATSACLRLSVCWCVCAAA